MSYTYAKRHVYVKKLMIRKEVVVLKHKLTQVKRSVINQRVIGLFLDCYVLCITI